MAKSSGSEKYAYLNRLSTEQLEELLRADIESPESGDVDVIFHILEVIEKREEEHPTAASLTRTGLGQSFSSITISRRARGVPYIPLRKRAGRNVR